MRSWRAGVELISARHECNAASMADAYAKATQELTLVSVHSGPGLTNALTGIGEAAKSRTPLLVLAGDVPTGAVKSNFHVEQAEMVRSVGAVSERIHTPASAREDTLRAVVTSAARPPDGRAEPADRCAGRALCRQARRRWRCRRRPGPLHPDPESVRRLADALASAERPLILAGRGAVLAGAEAALIALGRAHRRAAGDLDLRAWAVCRQPLVGRHQRRLCLAGGGRADLRERSHRRVRRQPDALDHEARQADRARRRRGASRRRGGQARLSDADPACRPGRCPGSRAGDPGRAGQARDRPRAGPAQCRDAQAHRGRRQPQRALSGHVDRPLHRSAHAEQSRRCDPAEGARRGFGLRPFLRLGAALPARAERQGLVPQPFLPVRRPRARLGHRPGHRQSGPAGRARRRRRRLPDVACRPRDRHPPRSCACAS